MYHFRDLVIMQYVRYDNICGFQTPYWSDDRSIGIGRSAYKVHPVVLHSKYVLQDHNQVDERNASSL